MNIKEFQPIRFTDEVTTCSCNSKDTQPVQIGDITQFQIQLDVCAFSPNLIVNGDFDDLTENGWLNSGFTFVGEYVNSDGLSESTLTTSTNILGSNLNYQLEVNISFFAGQPLYIYFGKNKIAEITQAGNHKIAGKCLSDNNADALIIVSPFGNNVSIELVACYILENNFALGIVDLNGVIRHLRTLSADISDANYTLFKIDRDVVTVSIPWSWFTDETNGNFLGLGCWRIGLAGLCQNTNGQLGLKDSKFATPYTIGDYTTEWRIGSSTNASVEVANGLLTYTGDAGSVATAIIINDGVAPTTLNQQYQVRLVIDTITNASVKLQLGATISTTYTTPGTKNFTIDSGNSPAALRLTFLDTSSPSAGSVEISELTITALVNDDVYGNTFWTMDFISNVFDLKETHNCTILLSATNNEDAYGLKFESSFYIPRSRFYGTLRATNPETSREASVDSFGRKIINYFEARIIKHLRLNNVPDYLANWLILFPGFNNVYIDDDEYTVEDEIDINYNRFCDSSKIEIPLGLKRQKLINTNKKGVLAVTDINNELVRTSDEKETIILIDGDTIALNG